MQDLLHRGCIVGGRRALVSAVCKRRAERGISLIELLVILVLLGMVTSLALFSWQKTRGRAEATSAARTAKVFLHRARMNSIYEGVNHFVVVDPQNKMLAIYADTGATPASFDATDRQVASTSFYTSVDLALPAEPATLSNPLNPGTLSSAWSLPTPDTSARWGSELMGLMLTPTGLVQSAEATPTTIGSGVIVFSDGKDVTTAVGIRGREGMIRSFEYFNGSWREL